jgi:hypothetical protein
MLHTPRPVNNNAHKKYSISSFVCVVRATRRDDALLGVHTPAKHCAVEVGCGDGGGVTALQLTLTSFKFASL